MTHSCNPIRQCEPSSPRHVVQIAAATNLACPIDGLPIDAHGTQRRCVAGHSFDMAREGYCNLLVVQHKASRDPGDSKDMVAARRSFLEAGHFGPLPIDVQYGSQVRVGGQVVRSTLSMPGAGRATILIAWAAWRRRARAWHARIGRDRCFEMGGQGRGPAQAPVTWLVANNRTPPFLAAASIWCCACLGFRSGRVSRKSRNPVATCLLVDPAADHLLELREIIYPTVRRSRRPRSRRRGGRVSTAARGRIAVFCDADRCRDDPGFGGDDAPRASHATGGPNALADLSTLSVTVDVAFRLLRLDRG